MVHGTARCGVAGGTTLRFPMGNELGFAKASYGSYLPGGLGGALSLIPAVFQTFRVGLPKAII